MGACTSVPKGMRDEATAPAPEQSKESVRAVETAAMKEGGKKKPKATTDEKKKEEATDNKGDISLGQLLVEYQAPKETTKEEASSSGATELECSEPTKVEVLPVSKPEETSIVTPPMVEAAAEEKPSTVIPSPVEAAVDEKPSTVTPPQVEAAVEEKSSTVTPPLAEAAIEVTSTATTPPVEAVAEETSVSTPPLAEAADKEEEKKSDVKEQK